MTRPDPIQQAINADLATIIDLDPTELGRRLHAAIERDRTHPSTPDGYPTKTPGASQPTTTTRPCPHPNCQHLTPCPEHDPQLTTTENAAHHRTTRTHDEHRTLTRQATRAINQAATLIQTAKAALDQQDKIRDHNGNSTEEGCAFMARIGAWEPIAHHVKLNGTTIGVGTWGYGILRRLGREPTDQEIRAHSRGQRIMVKAT